MKVGHQFITLTIWLLELTLLNIAEMMSNTDYRHICMPLYVLFSRLSLFSAH